MSHRQSCMLSCPRSIRKHSERRKWLGRVKDFGKGLFLELATLLTLSTLLRACGLRMYCQPIIQANQRGIAPPVKFLPKMSSCGGTSSFGVIVSVTVSFEESSAGRLLIEASSVCKLYDLRQLGLVSGLQRSDKTAEGREHCFVLPSDSLETSISTWSHRYAD